MTAATPVGGYPPGHHGVAYTGPSAFRTTASNVLSGKINDGDACLFLASASKLDAVRDDLGSLADGASYFDMSVQGRNPSRVLPAIAAFVTAQAPRPVCIVGEPVEVGLSEASYAEATLADLILGLPAHQRWAATMICLYDKESLSEDAADLFETSHSADVLAADIEASVTARFRTRLPPRPDYALRSAFASGSLRELRGTLTEFARANGLGAERTDDLVYAVNEAATNSVCHGTGRARVYLWREPRDAADDGDGPARIVCEVRDGGRIDDPLVGRRVPSRGATSGRGLWLVHQLCDLVQVRSSERGTQVRMFVDIEG